MRTVLPKIGVSITLIDATDQLQSYLVDANRPPRKARREHDKAIVVNWLPGRKICHVHELNAALRECALSRAMERVLLVNL